MLRSMLGRKWFPNNDNCEMDFVEWLRFATHEAREAMRRYRVNDWVTEQRQRQWSFAAKTMNKKDDRWAKLLMVKSAGGKGIGDPDTQHRRPGRPNKRWTDDILRFWNYTYFGMKLTDENGWLTDPQGYPRWMAVTDDFIPDASNVSVISTWFWPCAVPVSGAATVCSANPHVPCGWWYLSLSLSVLCG